MTKISQYPEIATPGVEDLLIGTDVENSSNATKNFTIQSIVDLVSAEVGITPTLQQVTIAGNTTNQPITAASFIKSSGTSSQYLMADGTIALKTYNETVILLSYDGTNFTYTNVINELGVTITFLVISGTLYCTLSSNVLTSGKTIVWAGSFVEFGGYLSAGNRASNNIATISLTNTNGTNNTFPTSFTDLPVRIQVYN